MAITEITSNNQFNQYMNTLETEGINTVAVDLEGEFNLHCYGEHLCLVQIYDGRREVIVDPVRYPRLTALDAFFTKRNLMKIMYDSSSDSSLVQHVRGVRILTILDLKPAVSLLQYPSQSLSSVLEAEFNIQVPNKKKFQRFNWMRRPLSHEAVDYAMNDVRMLFELKNRLFEKLTAKNLMDDYILKNLYAQNGEIKPLDKDRYKKANGYARLSSQEKSLFRKLFVIRDAAAKRANLPPNTLFPNKDLMNAALGRIREHEINQKISGKLSRNDRQQAAEELLAALRGKL